MALRKTYYFQDGGQFYLFFKEERPDPVDLVADSIVEYPYPVADADLDKAMAANNWFCSDYSVQNNLYPIPIHPYQP